MSHPIADSPTVHSPRILTLVAPTPPRRRLRSFPFPNHLQWLDVLTTMLGAPSAVPADLWEAPLPDDPRITIAAILHHIQQDIPLIDWWMLDDAESPDDFNLFTIPIYPQGFDTCNEEEFEAYGFATGLLAHLDGFSVYDLLWSPAPETVPKDLSLAQLLPALDALPAPMNGIAVIVAMLNHTTGTLLLDACPSCYNISLDEMTEWTDENLAWLRQDALIAKRIHARAFALETWVAKSPRPRLKKIWYTLRRLYRAAQAQPTPRLTSFTIAAEDFVAGRFPSRPKTLAELWAPESDPHQESSDPASETILIAEDTLPEVEITYG